jgi:hypothetical protein
MSIYEGVEAEWKGIVVIPPYCTAAWLMITKSRIHANSSACANVCASPEHCTPCKSLSL